MDITSKDNIRNAILKDLFDTHDRFLELSTRFNENVEDSLLYFRALVNQLSQPTCDPLVTKTPKILRKRGLQRIETIPENDILQRESTSASSIQTVEEEKETNEIAGRRSKRIASQRAVDNIKKQNSLMLHTKLRRPISDENDSISVKKDKNENQNKRKKSAMSSSDEDGNGRGSKFSKLDDNLIEKKESASKVTSKKSEQIAQSNEESKEQNIPSELQHSDRSASKISQNGEEKKIDDAIITPNMDDIEEPSMYEDAIGKPTPIMNSTMKHSSILPERILNATVVLERLSQQRKLNETIVIQKAPNQRNSRETKENTNLKKALQDNTHRYKEAAQDNMYNELITDDESSPTKLDEEMAKKSRKQIARKKKRAISVSSDDEVPNTPVKTYFKKPAVAQEVKTMYKLNALFSPYAKESVKKRVEAFEQAVMHSPKSVDVDAPTRITRTKTRAMAAAEAETEIKNTDKNVTQILARKSLAKAKKIAYLIEKQKKDNEDLKEVKVSANKEQMPERINKLFSSDKSNTKQMQHLKTTPLGKMKILPPTSASRLHTPSNTQNFLNYPKVLTASRANIVTTMDSFIQAPKTISKTNSVEKLEDKKRHEEDARKKREEVLRLQTEEKRRKRQEKELKNKLAREAKEKQELEKRQKVEKEKEEKARLAQLMQEKQREEMEKKRLAQFQRAQEKEERRKLEEQQRLQRLQEQEEAERLLAEQRRREQEAEKRKEAEVRAQQQAATEALKQKNQMLAAQAKYKHANNKHQGTTNYVLDSEPDEDESDDESKPKHEIPYWAQVHIRKTQLAMQRHVPEEVVYKFFDTRKCTPDLTELFHGIDRNRLKRTSSAIWKTPPRFSMMEAE